MVRQSALLAIAALIPSSFAQISDDFEGGLDSTKWATYAPDCSQGGSISLDTTTAHSGKSSVKVNGAGGYCGHIFFGTTAVPSGDVYVRTWVKAAKALTSSHVTFITMPDSTLGTNKHLRIGGQNSILMYNRESDDATLPDLSPQGVAASAPLAAGEFQCFEYHLGTDGTIETWLNGNAISALQAGPNANNPYGSQWQRASYKPKVKGIYFGWESYGGDTNTFWYDDVVVSSTRVGCGNSVPPASTSRASTATRTSSITSVVVPSSTTASSAAASTTASGPAQSKYGQCGGKNWAGPFTCVSGSTCTVVNEWYSQCL
ncbi:Polysaccharide monooxygenase [Paramyrothecium foliicola]|nr:Polysaccharide monooxygenase [Paramyrothecium foliicola]